MDKYGEIVNGPSAESTVPLNTQRCCNRCGERPRVHKQRWCRECRAVWKREHRRKNASSPVAQVPTIAVDTAGNTGPLVSPNTHLAAGEALTVYRTALVEYERARSLDWKRQRHPPAIVLVPIWERVEAAKQRCLALGISPDEEQPPPQPHTSPSKPYETHPQ